MNLLKHSEKRDNLNVYFMCILQHTYWKEFEMTTLASVIKRLSVIAAAFLGFVAATTQLSLSGESIMSDTSRTTIAPVIDRVIYLTVFVPKTPAQAYAYFTENQLLQSWLTAVAEVEPKVGGKFELFWQPDDRENNSTIGCRIAAITPGQFLCFQWRSPKQFKAFANAADPLTHVAVAFIPEASGTRVHLVHSGWRSTADWEEARLWQEKAWMAALKDLEELAGQ
jgi:uncharacterized protein YndB with AHSA1/START domain